MDRFSISEKLGKEHKEYKLDCFAEGNHDTLNYVQWLEAELIKYKNLAEQGRLLELPCRVGDTIYCVLGDWMQEDEVWEITIKEWGICFNSHGLEGLGVNWFLTREEAEAKLKEMESNENISN